MKSVTPTPRRVMALGHLGTKFYDLDPRHPRKDLLSRLARKRASKVYLDLSDGSTRHVGYIVAGEWFTFYRIEHWYGPTVMGERSTP